MFNKLLTFRVYLLSTIESTRVKTTRPKNIKNYKKIRICYTCRTNT